MWHTDAQTISFGVALDTLAGVTWLVVMTSGLLQSRDLFTTVLAQTSLSKPHSFFEFK